MKTTEIARLENLKTPLVEELLELSEKFISPLWIEISLLTPSESNRLETILEQLAEINTKIYDLKNPE
jgi:hypothetical protein